MPHTENIMELLVPLYEDFRSKTEKLIASFSVEESKVIESYFSKAIEIMNEATTVLTSDTDTTNRTSSRTSSPKKK